MVAYVVALAAAVMEGVTAAPAIAVVGVEAKVARAAVAAWLHNHRWLDVGRHSSDTS